MLEVALFGGLTGSAAFFFLRWRAEKARAEGWKQSLQFAQREVTRWKQEAEQWAVIADCTGGKLQTTEFRLPEVKELSAKGG